MVQQCVGNGIGILPGDAVDQQQLQSLMLIEIFQPLFAKPLFQTLAVTIMDRHIFHLLLVFPCYFSQSSLKYG